MHDPVLHLAQAPALVVTGCDRAPTASDLQVGGRPAPWVLGLHGRQDAGQKNDGQKNHRPVTVIAEPWSQLQALHRRKRGFSALCGRLQALLEVLGGEPTLSEVTGTGQASARRVRIEIWADGDEDPDRVLLDKVARQLAQRTDAELELEEAVRFTGVVTGEPKATLFDEADVFCLPTFYPLEGLPVVILEAMAAGLPVVSTERGAIPDVVRDGESGFLIPERNPRALAEALATLAHDPALRTAMGERGRALQREHYTAARFAGRIAEVLLEPGSESASRQRFGSAEVPAR